MFIILFNIGAGLSTPFIFSVHANVASSTKTIFPGDSLIVNTEVRSLGLGSKKLIDANVIYTVLDSNNNLILKKESVIALQTYFSASQVFQIPENAKPGMYHVTAEVNYDRYRDISSDSFFIKKKTILGNLFK